MIACRGEAGAGWLELVPPSDAWRRSSPQTLLRQVSAGLCGWAGITRVAELTHLDLIGLPTFQAVRPMGRALSVHQGKGRDTVTAKLSAILEAVESSCAERLVHVGPTCRFADLPAARRAAAFAHYGTPNPRRPMTDDVAIRWLAAENISAGGQMFVPFDLVSMDFSFDGDSPFVRSSLGLAAGACIEDATLAALYELVEREAQGRWMAADIITQAGMRVAAATIAPAWFHAVSAQMQADGLLLAVYAVPGAGGLPVVLCRIDEPGYAPSFMGAACRADPADALFRAFAEAAQSRLTVISGARDDIRPDEPHATGSRALGTPPHCRPVDWNTLAAGGHQPTIKGLCARLAADGYAGVVRIDISPPGGNVSVVKLVIPGLAALPAWTG